MSWHRSEGRTRAAKRFMEAERECPRCQERFRNWVLEFNKGMCKNCAIHVYKLEHEVEIISGQLVNYQGKRPLAEAIALAAKRLDCFN